MINNFVKLLNINKFDIILLTLTHGQVVLYIYHYFEEVMKTGIDKNNRFNLKI
jgi:hypothetical protein